jgi:hypothetical protein
VASGIGPEFKPQHHPPKKKITVVQFLKKSFIGSSSSVNTKYSIKTIHSQNIIAVIAQIFVLSV